VVFIEAAILILVYLWTGFRSLVRSLFLFLLLAAIPPLFNLNLVFHPDHLTLLLIVLTLYALNRDGLRFGKWYYLAAVFCGAATGTKYAGLYFFLTVLVYLLLGLYHRQTDVVGFVKHGFGFLVTKVAAVIATNPLLLRPDQFKVYLQLARQNAEINAFGFDVPMERSPGLWYEQALRENYGPWWFFALVFCVWGFSLVCDSKRRLFNILLMTWVLPLGVFLMYFVPPMRPTYPLLVLFPLFSCLGSPAVWDVRGHFQALRKGESVVPVAGLVLFAATLVLGTIQIYEYTASIAVSY